MMLEDEEEEECNCAAPYNTMATLFQLQAMKNKLNVAYLGSEMMKWNSSRTEIELKKISVDLQRVYRNFAKDQANAYLLLARCRYFNQEFYRNILEGVKTANVTVTTGRRFAAGVNLIKLKAVQEKTNQKVPFLSRGGQTIQEAKNAWSKLLKLHIKMVELRTNFRAIENAYNRATKRQHIIDQIVVPKTQATIKYIRVELEEMDREESHRIKMTLNKMLKCREANRICPCNDMSWFVEETGNTKNNIEKVKEYRSLIEEPVLMRSERQYQPVIILKDMHEPINRRSLVKLKSQQVITSLRTFYELVSAHSFGIEKEKEIPCIEKEKEIPKKRLSLGDCNPRLDPAIETTEVIDDFLGVCKDARHQLDNLKEVEQPSEVDTKLIDNLKGHINAVIHTNSKLHNSTVLAPNVRDFIQSCGKIDIVLKIANNDIDHSPLDEGKKKIVNNLIKNIDDVVKIITECKNKGLLTPSLEEFSKVFNEAKEKIGVKVKKSCFGVQRMDYLKKIVSDIEMLTADVRREGMESTSVQQFLKSCQGFKMRLEEHKKLMPRSQRRSIEAQNDEFITESILIFIMSCEDYILNAKHSKDMMLDMTSHHKIINKISDLMVKWQKQGILSKSTIEFMKNATNRWTNESSKKCDTISHGRFILSPQDESLVLSNANMLITTPDKTITPKDLTKNIVSPGKICGYQPEKCVIVNKIDNKPPPLAKSPKVSILTNKKVEKTVPENSGARTKPLPPNDNKGIEPFTQDPLKYKTTEMNTRSKFSEKVLLSRKDDIYISKESEMIVAEISAYDSCPVFETSNRDIWYLETVYDTSATEADSFTDPTPETSEQSVEKLSCLVYDKEKSDDCSIKRTYTM